MKIGRFAVKQSIRDHLRATFIESEHVAQDLPHFANNVEKALDFAFENLEEFEFGVEPPVEGIEDEVMSIRQLFTHVADVVNAAEVWEQFSQAYLDGWTRLFSKTEERSLAFQVRDLNRVIDEVEPFRFSSVSVKEAIKIAEEFNTIVQRQRLREKIARELTPLRSLRKLVNFTTTQTICDVSDTASEIHQQIYNPESLTYKEAQIAERRGKQSLIFQASLEPGLQWKIDASLLANTSWMRGILWSFIFAIRERAINRATVCPFALMVFDDPQMTFDTRNMKGWVGFLGRSEGLRKRQKCQLLVTTHSRSFALDMTPISHIRMAQIETGRPWCNPSQVVEGDFATVRIEKMEAENSDERARLLIGDIRVLAETLLKHAIESFEPGFARDSDTTLGRLVERIGQKVNNREAPYTVGVFGDLIAVKSSYPDLFRLLSEPHHSVCETITVREAKRVYDFWKLKLFPAVQKIWEEYRFLQKTIIGESAAILLPANCNHRSTRSISLDSAKPEILGRVSAYSDGRATSAIRIDHLTDVEQINLSALAAYRLERDTLSPIFRVGDIILTRLDGRCRPSNLVVEDRGAYLAARRWLEYAEAPDLAILAATSSNPREIPAAIISRARGANRRKIVGVLFAADRMQPGVAIDPVAEAVALECDDRTVASLVDQTVVFEVQGSSAEPIALENQFLLAKPEEPDLTVAVRELDGRPVIAESDENCSYFKRLRLLDPGSVVLESLDKSGSEGLVGLAIDPEKQGPRLMRVREVVGVVFDKL